MPESPFRRGWHAGVAISATLACRSRHFGDFGMPESPFRRLWHAGVAISATLACRSRRGRRSEVGGLRSAVGGRNPVMLTYLPTLLTYLTYLHTYFTYPAKKGHYELIDCPKGKSNESPSLRGSEAPRLRGSGTRLSAVGDRQSAIVARRSQM